MTIHHISRFHSTFHSMARVRGHEHGLPVLLEHQEQRGGVGGAGRGAAPQTPAGARGGARPQSAKDNELAHHQPKLLFRKRRQLDQEENILLLLCRPCILKSTEEKGREGCSGVRAVAAGAQAGGDCYAEDQEV